MRDGFGKATPAKLRVMTRRQARRGQLVEIDDRAQGLRRALLQRIGRAVKPSGVFVLQPQQFSHAIARALRVAAASGRAAGTESTACLLRAARAGTVNGSDPSYGGAMRGMPSSSSEVREVRDFRDRGVASS
jgi:hypothetical protein